MAGIGIKYKIIMGNGNIYNDKVHSQEELDKVIKNGTYLGKTYMEDGAYYSLFGSQMAANSFEGVIYQKIDEAIKLS